MSSTPFTPPKSVLMATTMTAPGQTRREQVRGRTSWTSWVLLFAAFVMQEIRVGAAHGGIIPSSIPRAAPCGVHARTIGGASFALEILKFGEDSDKKTWNSALAECRKLGMVCTPKYITAISP